ncbi:MAG TPA: hypothetical protein VHY91_09260 [Pirellulales bacterium]|jgi:hypothetical protein|nr:hypothetical protein [Pirellulales bacterium]
MSNESQDELFNRAREIVARYRDPAAQAELLDELQRTGLLDENWQVVFPVNGQPHDPKVDDPSA